MKVLVATGMLLALTSLTSCKKDQTESEVKRSIPKNVEMAKSVFIQNLELMKKISTSQKNGQEIQLELRLEV